MSEMVKYETEQGEVQLKPETIKKYLVSGNGKVTDQEVIMFMNLCKYQRLNPFLREAYLIKYSDKDPATIVTGKDAFTKRAANSGVCKGWEAGVIIQDQKGNLNNRTGTFVAPGENLVGGWAKVYRKDWQVPIDITVSLGEYQRRKRDGSLQSNWKSMPATMIRKVALVQALREAMPQEFQGLYSPEEMPVDNEQLENKPVNITPEQGQEEQKQLENERKQTSEGKGKGNLNDSPQKITKEQGKKLGEIYEELSLEQDKFKKVVCDLLERDVKSLQDLTREEGEKLINHLIEMLEERYKKEAEEAREEQ